MCGQCPGYDDSPFRKPCAPVTEDQLLLRKQVLYQAESEPGSFDMATWEKTVAGSCGTTRCIAGWALALSGQRVLNAGGAVTIEFRAVAALGLSREEYMGWAPGGTPWSEGGRRPLFYMPSGPALERLRELARVTSQVPERGCSQHQTCVCGRWLCPARGGS